MTTDKHNKRPNVPPLRFPEFTDEWKRTSIGECCSSLEYGMNAAAKEYDGRNKYIRITDIDETTSKYCNDDVVSPSDELEDKYLVRENDILFARTGASVGKTYHYDISDGKLYFAGFLIRGNVLSCYNSKFVFYQTQLSRYEKWVKVMSARSGQPGINSQEYEGFNLFMPTRFEQDKIESFISLLDRRIEVQSGLINKLESLISGIIERTIVQSPNVKIADCLDCHSSTLQENQLNESGGYRVYGANGICGYTDSPGIDGDAILIVKDGSGVGNVSYAMGKYSVIGTSNYLTAKNGYSLRYIYYSLKKFNFAPYKTGMAIPHIYFKDYGNAKIYCPSFEEQERIANYLSKIERKIEIERSIKDNCIMQKKYLLQQMFI